MLWHCNEVKMISFGGGRCHRLGAPPFHTPYGIHSDDNIWRLSALTPAQMQEFNVVEMTEERMANVVPSRSCIYSNSAG